MKNIKNNSTGTHIMQKKGGIEMKRRLLFISLTLALVLTTLMPSAAVAAKPASFGASGIITYISPGTVFPAGESGRWVVVERELSGTFLSGDIDGDFTMTYKANVELSTQAGNLHGTLETGPYVLKLNGKIQPLEMVPTPLGIELPKLTIYGRWTFTDGARGQGNFEAWVIFIPTPEGHVQSIVASALNLTGKWQP